MTKQADRMRRDVRAAVQKVDLLSFIPRSLRDVARRRLLQLFREHLNKIASKRRLCQRDVTRLSAEAWTNSEGELIVFTSCKELPCFIVCRNATLCDQECPCCGQLVSALQRRYVGRRPSKPRPRRPFVA